MVRRDHLTETSAAILGWLWELDTRAGGYARRGVRGWARREEVEAGLKQSVPELLPRLRDRALVEEELVQPAGTRPVAVYRITGLGDLLLARYQGREPRPPWPAGEAGEGDTAVYLAPGPALALMLLREALASSAPSRVPGAGPGWRTEDELWEQRQPASEHFDLEPDRGAWLPGDPPWQRTGPAPDARSAEPPVVFGRGDLDWLERTGLVQRSSIVEPGRTRPAVLWRVTRLGASVTLLEWHPPRST